MTIIRAILRFLLLLGDKLSPVKKIPLTEEQQQKIDQLSQNMVLYHYPACPFCLKVTRKMRALGMNVEKRDPRIEPYKTELLEGGGELQVPCLKIGNGDKAMWMYESAEIIFFLEGEFEEVVGEAVFESP